MHDEPVFANVPFLMFNHALVWCYQTGGRHLLEVLLDETEDVLEQAAPHYEWWQMTLDKDTAVTAEARYYLAVERLPS